jgi:hypothetical protein
VGGGGDIASPEVPISHQHASRPAPPPASLAEPAVVSSTPRACGRKPPFFKDLELPAWHHFRASYELYERTQSASGLTSEPIVGLVSAEILQHLSKYGTPCLPWGEPVSNEEFIAVFNSTFLNLSTAACLEKLRPIVLTPTDAPPTRMEIANLLMRYDEVLASTLEPPKLETLATLLFSAIACDQITEPLVHAPVTSFVDLAKRVLLNASRVEEMPATYAKNEQRRHSGEPRSSHRERRWRHTTEPRSPSTEETSTHSSVPSAHSNEPRFRSYRTNGGDSGDDISKEPQPAAKQGKFTGSRSSKDHRPEQQ